MTVDKGVQLGWFKCSNRIFSTIGEVHTDWTLESAPSERRTQERGGVGGGENGQEGGKKKEDH